MPSKHGEDVLQMLHESNVGIIWMKSIARSYMWWPGLDGDLEVLMRVMPAMSRDTEHSRCGHLKPWAQIHIKFALAAHSLTERF